MIEQSKIEQVARAIDPGRWKLLDSLMTPGHEADVLELPLAVQSLNQARAAIEALKVPTDVMLGDETDMVVGCCNPNAAEKAELFDLMITAALGDE